MKRIITSIFLFSAITASSAWSHEGRLDDHSHDADDSGDSSDTQTTSEVVGTKPKRIDSPADAFKAFSRTVRVRVDDRYLYIESNGLPNHNMMVGIRSWQQQVPLPQPFAGQNAWRLPLKPKLAASPISAKTNLFRGAIAIAVNGVPIFNALNNRGEDALLAGELDEWGGHCGRGDDYHYHTAPVHLEDAVGKGNPIAYALDGFPIYGYTEADGSDVGELDEFNGQIDEDGNYHYHATTTYPYINGGMRGEVSVRQGQIDPQPRDSPARPAGRPLRGATITGFSRTDNHFKLDYHVSGRKASIAYTAKSDGSVDFEYQDPSGKTWVQSYRRRGGGTYLPLVNEVVEDTLPNVTVTSDVDADQATGTSLLSVTSSAVVAGGKLPAEFTGDGSGQSPPVAWTKGPPGTHCYALSIWHTPPTGDVKSYWMLYDIPSDVTSLPRDVSGIGKLGRNDKGHAAYDPMRSRGPGAKEYHITVYALSENPKLASATVTRNELLRSITDITLAEGTLTFQYARNSTSRWLIIASAILAAVVFVVVALVVRGRFKHDMSA